MVWCFEIMQYTNIRKVCNNRSSLKEKKQCKCEQPKRKDSEPSSFTEGNSNKITPNDHNLKFQTAVLLLPHGGTTFAGKQRLLHSAILISIGLQWCESVFRNISSHIRYQSYPHRTGAGVDSPHVLFPVQRIFIKSLHTQNLVFNYFASQWRRLIKNPLRA